MEQRNLLLFLLIQLLYTATNGLGQTDPQISLYYSDTRHTYRGQSVSNYLEIPVATTNVRLTCEGPGIRWSTPHSAADNIYDNQWGTLTVKLLTIGETGLYKCYGAEGTSSVYIQANDLGMYVVRSDKEYPERLYPGRNFFISDEQDISYEFFCLMSNPHSHEVPTWSFPKYVIGTEHLDEFSLGHEYEQGAAVLSVKDRWNILLSGRYSCAGETITGILTNVSINIWSHATPIQRTTSVPTTTRTTTTTTTTTKPEAIDTTEETTAAADTASSDTPATQAINYISSQEGLTSLPPADGYTGPSLMGTLVLLTLGLAVGTNLPLACVLLNRIIPFIYSSIINIEITPIAERNVQNQDTSIVVGFTLALSIAVMGWLFSMSLICCLWCYIRRRRVFKLAYMRDSARPLSLKETSKNSYDTNLNNSNNNFLLNGYYPCTIRNFEKEPSPIGSTRSWGCSTPTYRVQSQEMLI